MNVERFIQNRPSRSRPAHGFTLVEIMLVVLILGILASVVYVKYTHQTEIAKINATCTTIDNIKLAIGQYEMEKGKYPDSIGDLVTGEKHYLDQETVPVDSWKHEFRFFMRGDLVKVQSAGPDGVFDTPDDLINK